MAGLSIDQLAELYRRANGCPSTKVPHRTYDLAVVEAERQNVKERKFEAPRLVQPYRCPYCSMWHVGRRLK